MRVLLDEGSLFDMTSMPSEKDDMLQLKIMLEYGDVEIWASSRSFASFISAAERTLGSDRLNDAAEETLTWLRVCPIGEAEIRAALSVAGERFEHRLDVACARQIGADFLITADSAACRTTSLPQGTAQDFMDYVEQKSGVRYAIVGL